jgi:Protein tyrosine phosphatase-like protein, PTPLA
MILAWSITEIIRYFFYAANMLQLEPRWLLWLRYNTFFVLYPLGASSEAALIFSTLPSHWPWNTWDCGRAVMFLIWWPGKRPHSTAIVFAECLLHIRSLRNVYLHDKATQEGFRERSSQPFQKYEGHLKRGSIMICNVVIYIDTAYMSVTVE